MREDDLTEGDNCEVPTNCTIQFNGQVTCLFKCKSTSECTFDLQQWPYDSQHCEIDWSIESRPQENVKYIILIFLSYFYVPMFIRYPTYIHRLYSNRKVILN